MRMEDEISITFKDILMLSIFSFLITIVGVYLISVFDYLPEFLLVPLIVPCGLGCILMFLLIVEKIYDTKNLTKR